MGVGSIAEALKTNSPDKIGDGVHFEAVGRIAQSWVNSPILGGLFANIIYLGIHPVFKLTQFNPAGYWFWRGFQILTGASVAYSIGRNDLANFVGPLAGGLDASKSGSEKMASSASVSQALRMLGGMAILAGIFNFSRNVTSTIGSSVLELNYAKAVAAELSTALVVDYFSDKGVPVSTSHTIMGSVLGLALMTAPTQVPFRFIAKIGGAWLLSIPVSALVSGGLYAVTHAISNIERDMAARPVEGLHEHETAAVNIARADRALKDAALARASLAMGRRSSLMFAGRAPFFAASGYLIGRTVQKMYREGLNEGVAEAAKIGVEIIPVAGGVAQAADGFYALSRGASWWTNVRKSPGEALTDIFSGAGWTLIDLFGVGILAKIFKGIRAAKRARGVVETLEGAEKAAAAFERTAGAAVNASQKAAEGMAEIERLRKAAASAEEALDAAKKAMAAAEGRFERLTASVKRFMAGNRANAASGALKEAQRVALGDFRRLAVAQAVSDASTKAGGGRFVRMLLRPGVVAKIDRAAERSIRELSIKRNYDELLRLVRAEFPDAAERVERVLERALPLALEKANPKVLERSARRALIAHGIPKGIAEGLLKGVEKRIPVGTFNLADAGSRTFFMNELEAAADAVGRVYSRPVKRYARMAMTVASEPLTLRMTFGGAAELLRTASNFLYPVKVVFRELGRGWIDTVNPLRFLRFWR